VGRAADVGERGPERHRADPAVLDRPDREACRVPGQATRLFCAGRRAPAGPGPVRAAPDGTGPGGPLGR